MTSREAFEAWYDAQPNGRIQPFAVWQAATEAERARKSIPDEMSEVADRFAHRMALVLECVLMDRQSDRWWNDGMQLIGEYRSAMNEIHERESPTHMGEPLIREGVGKIRSGEAMKEAL